MQLPKLNTPTYQLKIPSTGQMLQYRPFLVKEEKILLMAQESGKSDDVARATIQIINACLFDKIDDRTINKGNYEASIKKLEGMLSGK